MAVIPLWTHLFMKAIYPYLIVIQPLAFVLLVMATVPLCSKWSAGYLLILWWYLLFTITFVLPVKSRRFESLFHVIWYTPSRN
jgi:hypothetical protein